MHRSTRLRRLAVAFLVVLVLAVAARFARASSAGVDPASECRQNSPNDKFFLPIGAL